MRKNRSCISPIWRRIPTLKKDSASLLAMGSRFIGTNEGSTPALDRACISEKVCDSKEFAPVGQFLASWSEYSHSQNGLFTPPAFGEPQVLRFRSPCIWNFRWDHVYLQPLRQASAAETPARRLTRDREHMRKIGTPTAMFRLTSHRRIALRTESFHCRFKVNKEEYF